MLSVVRAWVCAFAALTLFLGRQYSLAAFATARSVGILTMLCIVQEYESKAAELRAKQAARRGETAAQGDAENDDKGAEVSVMLFCLCVVPCKTIYMCLYVSMNLSMNLSICVSVCLPTFHSIIEGQALGG